MIIFVYPRWPLAAILDLKIPRGGNLYTQQMLELMIWTTEKCREMIVTWHCKVRLKNWSLPPDYRGFRNWRCAKNWKSDEGILRILGLKMPNPRISPVGANNPKQKLFFSGSPGYNIHGSHRDPAPKGVNPEIANPQFLTPSQNLVVRFFNF